MKILNYLGILYAHKKGWCKPFHRVSKEEIKMTNKPSGWCPMLEAAYRFFNKPEIRIEPPDINLENIKRTLGAD